MVSRPNVLSAAEQRAAKVVVFIGGTEREMKVIRATSRPVGTPDRRSGLGEGKGRPRGGGQVLKQVSFRSQITLKLIGQPLQKELRGA